MNEDDNNVVHKSSQWGGIDNNRLETTEKFEDGSVKTSTIKFTSLSPLELQRIRSLSPTTKLEETIQKVSDKPTLAHDASKSGLYWFTLILTFLILFVASAVPMEYLMDKISGFGMNSSSGLGSAGGNGLISFLTVIARIYTILWVSKWLARFVSTKLQRSNKR